MAVLWNTSCFILKRSLRFSNCTPKSSVVLDKEEEKPTELVGVLHGLGTFPALLALWGRLFGMRNMSGILCVCYLLSIGNVWLLCRNLHFRRTFTLLSTALYAVSPVFLWSAQNTLTEIVLAAFITQWFVCLTDDDKNLHPFFSVVPILGVSMLHILISVLMPLIVILYVCQYLQTGKRSFFVGAVDDPSGIRLRIFHDAAYGGSLYDQ